MRPLLSIIIPTYNRPGQLKNRLFELEGLNDIELIIVNDGSSQIYSNKYFSKTFRIVYLNNTSNIGRGNSIIKGIKNSSGIYISFFDDEDEIIKDNLNQILIHLKSLGPNYIGLIAETDQNTSFLKNDVDSYLVTRFTQEWSDRKEFVNNSILKSSIPFWLKGRRIPTSFLFSLCDTYGKKWKYLPLIIVNKTYGENGLTSTIRKNPFKKSLLISLIFLVYRKVILLKNYFKDF